MQWQARVPERGHQTLGAVYPTDPQWGPQIWGPVTSTPIVSSDADGHIKGCNSPGSIHNFHRTLYLHNEIKMYSIAY